MHNESGLVLEVVLDLFVAITVLFVVLIRLDQPFDRTTSTHDRHGNLHAAWVRLYLRPSHRKANRSTGHDNSWTPERPVVARNWPDGMVRQGRCRAGARAHAPG
jgi:hypothetical protein